MEYVSRAGAKLKHAVDEFGLNINRLVCADFGSSTGGFVDCLIQEGAAKVYAIETGYGVLDWKLRQDERIVVMERTNAMHVRLPEMVQFISMDTSWTKLEKVLPNALLNLAADGQIVALVKPHYEAPPSWLQKGKLPDALVNDVLESVKTTVIGLGLEVLGQTDSPIVGSKGKNKEVLIWLRRRQ